VLRDAKDIAALSKDKKGVKPNGSNGPNAGKETSDDRDR
jgi:hypothetical protein